MAYRFEKLNIWIDSVKLIKDGYIFCQKLPRNEERNLTDQLRRAITSVSL